MWYVSSSWACFIWCSVLAEVQCCDGSDEQAGVCPNLCKEIGEEYRTKRDAELKIQRAVSRMYPHGFFWY